MPAKQTEYSARGERLWKRAAIAMSAVTIICFSIFLPPIIADTTPDRFYSGLFIYLEDGYRLPILKDSDRDGLPDGTENRLGTNSLSTDTDGDTLTDYQEALKYHTNPRSEDSDGDGAPDSDWQERREYAYTIRAVVDLRPPFNLEHMNDTYQDARPVEMRQDHAGKQNDQAQQDSRVKRDDDTQQDDVRRFEVILYADAYELLNPSAYEPKATPFTAPTYAKNWTVDMAEDIRKRIGNVSTDIQAVVKVMRIFQSYRYVRLDRDLGYSTDLPLQFDIYLDDAGQVHRQYSGVPLRLSMKEIQERVFFARGMYSHRTHGACSSAATLRGGLLRAAGLEERTVFSVPLFYTIESDGTRIDMHRDYPTKYIDLGENSLTVTDHFYNEVRIGNRWIRIDSTIDPGLNGPNIKLLLCNDQANHYFEYWDSATWIEKRPYRYVSIEDRNPVHSPPSVE